MRISRLRLCQALDALRSASPLSSTFETASKHRFNEEAFRSTSRFTFNGADQHRENARRLNAEVFSRAMRADAGDSGINESDSLEINALDSKKPVFPPIETFFLHLRRPLHRISGVAPFLGAPKK